MAVLFQPCFEALTDARLAFYWCFSALMSAALFSAFVCGINMHSVIFHYVTYRPSRLARSYPKNTIDSVKCPLSATVWTLNMYLLRTVCVSLHMKLLQCNQRQKGKKTQTDYVVVQLSLVQLSLNFDLVVIQFTLVLFILL